MKLKSALLLGALLAGGSSLGLSNITVVNVTGSSGSVAVAPEPLAEDVLSAGDRVHQYNGIPSSLTGAQFLRVLDEDRTSGDYALELNVDIAGILLLFLDNGIGDGLGGTNPWTGLDHPPSLGREAPQSNSMDWVAEREFVDTGVDIGIDEEGDGSINNTSSVFAKPVQPGNIILGPQNFDRNTHMFGVAFIPDRLVGIFAAQPDSIVRGTQSTLGWLVKPGATVTLSGIGDVTAQTVNGRGTLAVTPTETTRYTVTASHPGETDSVTTSVVVTGAGGLVGWWPLDEAEGIVVPDNAGLAPDGVILMTSRTDPQLSSGSFSWETQGGRFGGALFLDGVGGGGEVVDVGYGPRLEIPDTESFEFRNGQSFTVALWYKTDNVEDNQGLVTKGYDTRRVSNYWQLQTRVGTFAYDSRPTLAGDPRARIDSTSGISHGDDRWHHFVVIRDNVAAEIRLIVDGVNVTHYRFVDHPPNDGNWEVGTNDRPLMFGTHNNRFTRGSFDDIGIWRRALGAAEIQTIFNYGIQALSAVGPLDVIGFTFDRANRRVAISWNSLPDKTYTLMQSLGLSRWVDKGDSIPSAGFETAIEVETTPNAPVEFFRIREN